MTKLDNEMARLRNSLTDPLLKALFDPPPIRKARKAAREPMPLPSTGWFTIIGPDGRLCVSVALEGPLGVGKRMVVDEADWRMVSMTLGTHWTLKERKAGYAYVVGLGAAEGVTLARRIMRASDGEVVSFRNSNRLDLSRGNLEVVDAQVFVKRNLKGLNDAS